MIKSRKKKAKKKVIFLGKKYYAAKALEFLIQSDVEIQFVVAPDQEPYRPSIKDVAEKYQLTIIPVENLYPYIRNHRIHADLVISYLFWQKIKWSLFELAKNGCVNYHPAILPNYKGLGGYNLAILNNLNEWGSSVHYIDTEQFDSGPIIDVQRFDIDVNKETALSLEKKTQSVMYRQFQRTILDLIDHRHTKTRPNEGGRYFSKADYDKYKRVNLDESANNIERKIRAFWYPPYEGAFIQKKNQRFTLVTSDILKKLRI